MNTTASKLVINARKGNNEKEKDSKILHLNYTMLPYCDLRVRAKNEKARKNTVHKKSQHFNARNLGNTSSLSLSLSESLS